MSIINTLLKWIPLGKVPEMDALSVFKILEKDNIQIVDVRSRIEWKQSNIKGSINLPIAAFTDKNVQNLSLSPDLKTVVICLSAHRSIPAVRKLISLNFKDVHQLKGGMISWWKAKLPTQNMSKSA